jgi:hypothetical protein
VYYHLPLVHLLPAKARLLAAQVLVSEDLSSQPRAEYREGQVTEGRCLEVAANFPLNEWRHGGPLIELDVTGKDEPSGMDLIQLILIRFTIPEQSTLRQTSL